MSYMNQKSLMAVLTVVAMVFATGCQTKQTTSSVNSQADLAFAGGADRPPTPTTLNAMARLLIGQNRDTEAAGVLRRVMLEHPNFVPAYVEMAGIHMRRGHVDRAIATLATAHRISPKDPVVLNNIGMCWMMKNDAETALRYFVQASEVDPENGRYWSNQAVALGTIGRYDESLAFYMKLMEPAEAHYNVGVLCKSRNDLARAEIEFQRARDLGFVFEDEEKQG